MAFSFATETLFRPCSSADRQLTAIPVSRESARRESLRLARSARSRAGTSSSSAGFFMSSRSLMPLSGEKPFVALAQPGGRRRLPFLTDRVDRDEAVALRAAAGEGEGGRLDG